MRRLTVIAAAAAVLAAGPLRADVAPGDLAFENGALPSPLTDTPGDPVRGRAVLADRGLGNCIACHMNSEMQDVPWHGEVGPPLDGVADRWSEAELRGIVANAKMTFEGTIMPAFYKVDGFIRPGDGYTGKPATEITPILTAQQIEDIVAYLMTLKFD